MQAFTLLTTAMDVASALTSTLSDTLQTLQSRFYGPSAPTGEQLAEGMDWADSGTGYDKHYRGGQFHVRGEQILPVFESTGVTGQSFVLPFAGKVDIVSVVVLPVIASSGSDASNNWEVRLLNNTSGLELFSTNPNTDGNEFASLTVWEQNVDQNATVTPGQSLLLGITANGSPTAVPCKLGIRYRPRYD